MRSVVITAILGCLSFLSSASAVGVHWESTGGLSSGESIVSTSGTLVYAYNLGNATTYTANSVPFKGTASGAVADLAGDGNVHWSPVDSGGGTTFNNLSGDFGTMLDSAAWGLSNAVTTITLHHLTDGENYTLQIFSSDTRNGKSNTLVLDSGTANEYSSVVTSSVNSGAYVTGTFVADATQQASFTFRYSATSGNANINAIQLRKAPHGFVHPGIGLSRADLDAIKANLNVEPWKTGYEDLLAASQSSLSYTMQGPFVSVTHKKPGQPSDGSDAAWTSDMIAVHNLARLWYFTGNAAYAQKARGILISWATTQTLFVEGEVYLEMGYNAFRVFEGADILRSTWPGWTAQDTTTCKAYFENVWWDPNHIPVPHPLRSANQGMSQFAAALGVAVFNDDEEKFAQCLQVFRADAAAALRSSLPNGQVGDTGRDAHDQGQLMLMAWSAEVFWNQGVDVYAEYDNRMLAAAEYLSRFNLLVDTPFVQAGTVYDVYPKRHFFDGEFENWGIETKMVNILYNAFVVRKGMRSPYLEKYLTYTTQNSDSFCYLKPFDTSTATVPDPIVGPAAVASVTSLSQSNLGDCSVGSAAYDAGTKTWTVTGRGSSLSAGSADLHFAYLPVTGDATMIAKLESLSGTDSNARAGVLITSALNESSPMHAIVTSNPSGDNTMFSIWRNAVARSSSAFAGSGTQSYDRMPDPKVPYWLKIERIGNRVNSYSSPDGASWSCGQSADYDFGPTAYIGLAISSDTNSSTATATFTNVRITGGDGGEASNVPLAPHSIMASPGGDQIPLRWLESFEATRYKIWRTTTPGGSYTLVTQQSGTSYIDTNVLAGAYYYYAVSAVNALGESPLSPESTFSFPDTSWYEAENFSSQYGIKTEGTSDFYGGKDVGYIGDGDWCGYNGIRINSGAVFKARVAGFNAEVGQIEVRIGSTTGTLIATANVIPTGGTQNWGTVETAIDPATPAGVYNLYLVFKSGAVTTGPGFNINWFDITYPGITEYDLGMDKTITYASSTHALTNLGLIKAWNSASTHLKLADGSNLANFDFTKLGITSWATTDFSNPAAATIWDGAKLSGITLISDGNFGAGDSFVGADFSNLTWGTPTSTADPSRFFSGGSGATSAATKDNAIRFLGANLSLITGQARTTMIHNLGGFDGTTPIGAKFDPMFITHSGWNQADLIAAGWQFKTRMLVNTFKYAEGAAPAISISDLAQSQYFSSSATGAQEGSEHAQLFNGNTGNEDGDTADPGEVRLDSGNTITVTFNTSVNTLGYDLTGINTVFGWNPASNGRSNQGYEVILTYVNGSTATLAGPTHWEPNSPASYWTEVSFANESGAVLESGTIVLNDVASTGPNIKASGVKAVTFKISNNANAGAWVLAREFDIFGTPTAAANTHTDLENWRFLLFGTYGNSGDAADDADPDGDGIANLGEYNAGTDPLDIGSAFKITQVIASDADMLISFATVVGKTYRLESSTTLLESSWATVQNNIPGTGAAVLVTDPNASGQPCLFYRAVVSP